ncbi:hypothetical protein GS597_03630 [Synechococcales cyanobacterium C]|uniref:Uncharacterized protein n=1 Tax=Petrachloros mirabilis ULC683 TaxID=2781853 RepID=A0A8K1ZXC5_9CYAN|nr:hypothetical protein [Petrachloros mirabilis]NCJ05612.1 hypothetical protein [Petrachloros mirabilis ULC683]
MQDLSTFSNTLLEENPDCIQVTLGSASAKQGNSTEAIAADQKALTPGYQSLITPGAPY